MSVTKAKTIALDASRKSIFLEQAVHNGVGAALRQPRLAASKHIAQPFAPIPWADRERHLFSPATCGSFGSPATRQCAVFVASTEDIVQFMTTPVSDFMRTEVACVPQ
ncbi:hypothetical protein EVAR_88464_1 [Eumeta japonica]|uniref:Uncharacterized protein n=1 Tax=Eumeta variegata TaxID=151549 RepID=A0A4C1XUU9_EUMVA|nr:hypothetical protein EVAR_88464_1 [Eumeta japonica]